ncbi:MAG: TetR/AcrR family transcriptional regulator [Candidatus Aminicenantes bacterium]|nr:TetR/AcrR family transcriptional regulator [Candidatus Aminicenantes bacterium]
MPKIVNKEEKKGQILEAAIKVFSKKGLNNTKISDIAEEAAIGKGTLYEYFKSKDEIFAASFYYFMGKFEEGISHRLFRIQDPLEKLRAYFTAWTEMLEGDYLDYLEIVLDFWAEGVRERNDSWMIDLNKLYSENRDILDSLLSDCISKGEIKPVDTKLIASIMLGALDGILIQWVMDRKAFNMKEAVLLLVKTMIEGLNLTGKPVKE